MADELKEARQQLGEATAALREVLEGREDEQKVYDEFTSLTQETLTKIQDQIEALETKLNRPEIDTENKDKMKAPDEYSQAFSKYCRYGENKLAAPELKVLSEDTDSEGGYWVPPVREERMIEKLIEFSPVRELAEVVTISRGDTYEVPREGDTNFSAGWVSEQGSRAETTAGTVALETIPVNEMYANPFITQKLQDDVAFDLDGYIERRIIRRFGVLEGTAFVNGDGVGKPEGFLQHASVASIASGHATLITADQIIAMAYALPELYFRMSTWLGLRATFRAIRQLKDGVGDYLWQPGLALGQPSTILERPYREAIDMPAVAASAKSLALGDWSSGYRIVDRQGMRIQRDPFSSKPKIEFYTTKRIGGQVVLAEAIKIMTIGV